MSDQDFFFDEDEQPKKEAAPKSSSSSAKGSGSKPSAKSATPAQTVQTVSMTVAALIGVVALLAGVVIGIVLPIGAAPDSGVTQTEVPAGAPGSGAAAPELSPEQLNSGQLPPGHPDLGAMGGSGEATGSAETTGN